MSKNWYKILGSHHVKYSTAGCIRTVVGAIWAIIGLRNLFCDVLNHNHLARCNANMGRSDSADTRYDMTCSIHTRIVNRTYIRMLYELGIHSIL